MITPKEWKFVLTIAGIVVILTIAPWLYGLAITPVTHVFLWTQYINIADFPVYFSYLEQIGQGHILLKDLFTSEEQARLLFNPFFLVVGLLAKLFSLPPPMAWQIIRLLLIAPALMIFYSFFAYFFQETLKRKIAFLLLVFSSGLGVWFGQFFYNLAGGDNSFSWYWTPMDVWVPESNTFLALYHNPLHLLALALIVLTVLLWLKATERDSLRHSFLAGVTAFILILSHPYHIPTLLLIPLLWILALRLTHRIPKLWPTIKHYLILAGLMTPAIAYHLYLLLFDFSRKENWAQSFGFTPHPTVVLISYGLPLALAVLGWKLLKAKQTLSPKFLFCFIWFSVGFFLLYAWFLEWPRRLSQGLQVPLTVFAAMGLHYLWNKWRHLLPASHLAAAFIIVLLVTPLFLLSPLYIMVNDLAWYSMQSNFFSLPRETYKALQWIKKETPPDAVILTSPETGNILPGLTGRTVFSGHFPETARYWEKLAWMNFFFSKQSTAGQKQKFLKQYRVSHLVWDFTEDHAGQFNPDEQNFLIPVFKTSTTTVYKVDENVLR